LQSVILSIRAQGIVVIAGVTQQPFGSITVNITSSANALFLHQCNFSHYVDHVLTCLWRKKNELNIDVARGQRHGLYFVSVKKAFLSFCML
jgi:hypothetical protein